MAIVKRPTGEVAAISAAGREIGKAQAREKARQEAQRAQEIQLRLDAEQRARQWEFEKMMIRSQQDFAHEQRIMQADLDAEARAKEWQVEKMELASRLDFEQDERERLRYKEEYRAGRNVLDENKENMGDEEYKRALYRLDTIYARKGVDEAVTGLGFDTREKKGLFGLGISPPTPDIPTIADPLGLNIAATPALSVPGLPDEILSLEQQNKFRVISPDGKTETIDAAQWPEKKTQGYVLAEIARKPYTTTTLGEYGGF